MPRASSVQKKQLSARTAKAKAASKAEKRAWQRDHPGQEYPDPGHPCFLTDRQYTDLQRWQRQRERKQARAPNRMPKND